MGETVKTHTLRTPVTSTVAVVLVSLVIAIFTPLDACVDPASLNAMEVVFNKPGASYDPAVIEELAAKGFLVKVDDSTYVNRWLEEYSVGAVTQTASFLVVIYVEKFSEGAPYVEGVSDPGKTEYYLGVRLELLPPTEELPEEVFRSVFVDLIYQLIRLRIIIGVTSSDVEAIESTIRPGYAGWNNRLVYSAELGKWAPYVELVTSELIKGVLYRGNACAYQLPQDVLVRVKEVVPLNHVVTIMTTPTTQPGNHLPAVSTASPQSKLAENGLITTIALLAGVLAGFVAYLIISRKL